MMNNEFRKLLDGAKGLTQHVIVVNIDIRGFSSFCQNVKVESLDVATYITKIYAKIIDDFFPEATYYKPTGDGLLIISKYNEDNLKTLVQEIIDFSLKLLDQFSTLLSGDPMITYPTPQNIGIGITRGSACCILSNGVIVDYSGRILNLAARLMDVARPSGIVFDASFGIKLLDKKTQQLFADDKIYVRGVSEKEKLLIYYTKDHTNIDERYKQPFEEIRWEIETRKYLVKVLKELPNNIIRTYLKQKPLNKQMLKIRVSHPNPKIKSSTFYDAVDIDSTSELIEFDENGFGFPYPIL